MALFAISTSRTNGPILHECLRLAWIYRFSPLRDYGGPVFARLPFDCEFCDVIIMNGHIPRSKTPRQLIAELEMLRARGWKDRVFIVDDNFIGNKKQTKTLLREMIKWRCGTGAQMGFLTEDSANLADDSELCDLMVRAGLKKCSWESRRPASKAFEECKKVQNRGRDLVDTVNTIQRAGLEVMGGFIVGFDHDKLDIFSQQFNFIQRSGVATAMVGLLNALPKTRLYRATPQGGQD